MKYVYIKFLLTATDQFREDIRKHAGPDLTDVQVDKFVNSFKRTTPAMQRFAERKFEVLLEEREDEINKKEAEIQKLETGGGVLQFLFMSTAEEFAKELFFGGNQ